MRWIILLTLALECCVELQCAPLPAGQIIKYRVSSKYFDRNNETSRESLYNLLTQIHYGDAAQPEVAETTTNEAPETPTVVADVTEQQTQEDESDSGASLAALIEKVVNDEIEKLAGKDTTISPSESNESDEATTIAEEITAADEDDTSTVTTSIIDLDGETEAESSSTNAPDDVTTHQQESTETSEQKEEEEEEDDDDDDEGGNEASQSLLSAVGDLLSSVLGIAVESIEDDSESAAKSEENLHTTTTTVVSDAEHTTELIDGALTEVDEKIENLNEQNTLMTENAPELLTEAVTNDGEEEEQEVLEVLTPVADEEDTRQPVSIEASVNHVMSLVKGAAESADKQMKDVLTQIGSSLGLTESTIEEETVDELKSLLTTHSFDPETIKNFETDINEMANGGGYGEDHENFVPNDAKAAMLRYPYDHDF